MSGSLAAFQDAFAEALYGRLPSDHEQVAALTRVPGFSVYRNTVLKAEVDALHANFPAVARLVGDAWLRAAAAVYVNQSPPDDVRLLRYGAGFPEFLEQFGPAKELPYLANVARLDLLWIEAHISADDDPIDPLMLASLSAEQLEQTVLRPRASARWVWFDEQPAYTLWRVNREGVDVPADLAWQAEGALLLRPRGEVVWRALPLAGVVFLDACARGLAFDAAAEAALSSEPEADFGAIFGELIAMGAIGR